MSYIQDRVTEHENSQQKYSIAELETIIADHVSNSIKQDIDLAIKDGKKHTGGMYDYEEGSISWYSLGDSSIIDGYLSNSYGFSLISYLFGQFNYNNDDIRSIQRQIDDNQANINLHSIERLIISNIQALGAKQVNVRFVFCEYYTASVWKSGWTRKLVQEQRPLNKYKLCYYISW